ncbi:MAG: M20/M25/M40 family metallo-hydrolase [Clostridia bacterium]|nr:M20/M25/M40 family metallo-hydrolase [Clostridia bacterium]
MLLYIVLGVLAVLILLLAIIIIRALAFKPIKEKDVKVEDVDLDHDKVVSDLAKMIKCRTVSSRNKSEEDEGEFEKFRDLLPELFPEFHKIATRELIGDRGILYRWQGKSNTAPSVLMAHYDVVSVEEQNWSNPAFEGLIIDGVMWGRGVIDTKITLNGIMQAAEKLAKEGFVPENDLYFSFAGDEEIMGQGTPKIVDWFEKNGIVPAIVLDEGGAVVNKVFPGVKKSAALIGIAEKGMADIELSMKSSGGHASRPPAHTIVGQLSQACVNVEKKPMKFKLSSASKGLFATMGRNSSFVYKLIFANLFLFKPLLDKICKASGGEMNALVRTTVAFTQMKGSKGSNVLPPEASMVANVRIIEGETVESVVEQFKKRIKNDKIEVKALRGNNPSPSSLMSENGYGKVKEAILQTWGEVIVSPYLMVACSDSRHYCRISNNVFRFSAMALSGEERALIHGNDERIATDKIVKASKFFFNVIKKC